MKCFRMDLNTAKDVCGVFNGKSINPVKQEDGTYLIHCSIMDDSDFDSIIPILLLCEVVDV